jgi:hypothetical protein
MKDNIARTKEDFDLGILKGKTVFPFGYPGKKNMTMNTPIGTVPYPIEVYGLTNNKITDYKVMQPGQDALVDGDTIIEKKINKMNKMNYQEGGDMANIVDLTMDENGNKLTFSQAFSKAKQEGLSSFIWEGDSYDTGIKEDMKVTEAADADEMEDMEDMETMEDELPMQQMMPEAKKGMNIQSKFYGKNWPVGDELSGNAQPHQYFDNKRHYKTRGNYPLTGDEFLDKAMMYGQRGLNLPKAQQMGDISFLTKPMSAMNKVVKDAKDLYKKDRIDYFSNRDYENMPFEQLQDIRNMIGVTGLDNNPNYEYFKESPYLSMQDKKTLRSTYAKRRKEKKQQALDQLNKKRQQEREAQSTRDAFMGRVEEFKKPRPRQFYNVPVKKPTSPFRGKGPGHGNLPSINRQDGGYTDMVYPTLMDEAKELVRMGRDYDYDYGLHEIGGYRDGGKLPKWLYEARGRAMKKNMGYGGMMHAQEGIDQSEGQLYVPSVKDPRYQSYSDSLQLHNKFKNIYEEDVNKNYDGSLGKSPDDWFKPAEGPQAPYGKGNLKNEKNFINIYRTTTDDDLFNFINSQKIKPSGYYVSQGKVHVPYYKKPTQEVIPTNTLYNLMMSYGLDPSFKARKEMAERAGVSNYQGTAEQNEQLMQMLNDFGAPSKTLGPVKEGMPRAFRGGMMYAQEGVDYRAAMIPAEQTGMRPSLNFVPPPTASYNVNPLWNREAGYDLLINPTLGTKEVPAMQKMINQHNNYMDKYGYLLDDDDYLGRLQYEKGMRDALKEKQRYERAYDNYAKGKRKPRKFKKNGGMMSKYKKGDVIQYKKGGRVMTGVVDGYTNDGRIRLK